MTAFRRTLILTFSHLHEWLPGTSTTATTAGAAVSSTTSLEQHFVSSLQNAGIHRVAFLRHGNAPGAPGLDDFDRQLSKLGKEQTIASGASFGRSEQLLPLYSTLIASPSPRTIDTAHLFLKAANATVKEVLGLPILYDGTMQPGGNALFKKIGYVSLREYIDCKDDERDRKLARSLFGMYAHDVMGAMMKVIKQERAEGSVDSRSTLLVVGHALYLPSVALGVASVAGCRQADEDLILDNITNEAEGYLVNLSDGSVNILSRPPS
jgi:broad specificity phosphatase PhoE